MEPEQTIRQEAKSFYDNTIYGLHSPEVINDFRKVKTRLSDFYSPDSKAIFLDELKLLIVAELEKHRLEKHGGVASPTCPHEIRVEKLLFYIQQEVDHLPKVLHQKFATKGNRSKVFISYSHADAAFLQDIKRHFKPFQKHIDYWDDTKIEPGKKWKDEIRSAIQETKVAILLVSTDFLGSDFIATDEVPPLLEAAEKEGATILAVILKPCLFEEFSNLNEFQAVNPPDKPVSMMNENERETLYVNLVKQTLKLLKA